MLHAGPDATLTPEERNGAPDSHPHGGRINILLIYLGSPRARAPGFPAGGAVSRIVGVSDQFEPVRVGTAALVLVPARDRAFASSEGQGGLRDGSASAGAGFHSGNAALSDQG